MTVGTDTYITSTQYTTYADARGIVVNTATIEADLILSADFINTYYNLKEGYALPSDDLTKVESMLKIACKACELQQSGRLTLDESVMTGALIASESSDLTGTASESITYVDGGQITYKPRAPELDLLISKAGIQSYSSTGLVRG